jgi:hypothetical protein
VQPTSPYSKGIQDCVQLYSYGRTASCTRTHVRRLTATGCTRTRRSVLCVRSSAVQSFAVPRYVRVCVCVEWKASCVAWPGRALIDPPGRRAGGGRACNHSYLRDTPAPTGARDSHCRPSPPPSPPPPPPPQPPPTTNSGVRRPPCCRANSWAGCRTCVAVAWRRRYAQVRAAGIGRESTASRITRGVPLR